jgi:diaminohydroxyphosphoribosylaminopyrimidine deaminase/5-amino-6-(5-phosphoribosylamino)uracil reductase
VGTRVTKEEDARWMRRALTLAASAAGETNPNPLVGCVVVQAGRAVGEGCHARAGLPHAEVIALDRAGRRARGATLYVNLEPCAHHGRTPPCAPRVAAAGVRRVVVAQSDPNPLVNGRGLALLRRHGVAVTTGALAAEAARLNERFLRPFRTNRPFVTLKAALTLDGKIATAAGDSKWITGPAARAQARRLRRLHDAVLVGIGTVLADDPLLLPQPTLARPFHRVVLDSRFRIPLTSRLVRSASRAPLIVAGHKISAAKRRALAAAGVTVWADRGGSQRVRLPWLMRQLMRHGIRSLMVEGGSAVLGTFLAARIVDSVALYRAPSILGGQDSLSAFGGRGPRRVSAALALSRVAAPAGLERDEAQVEFWRPRPMPRVSHRRRRGAQSKRLS